MVAQNLPLKVGAICIVAILLIVEGEGRLVETIKPKSCLEIRYVTKNATAHNGFYTIYIGENEIQTVYCDFQSDPPFVWTLVESFTRKIGKWVSKLPGHESFQQPYYYNYPFNECNPQFKAYRLGKKSMASIANSPRNTHWRVTCNFQDITTFPMSHRDYWRNSMCRYNVMTIARTVFGCYWVDYINVRGYTCRNCLLAMYATPGAHMHFQSSTSLYYCHKNVFPSRYKRYPTETNFGHFHTYNVKHSCSATRDSTTNWWFGGVYQPQNKLIHSTLL